MGGEVVNGSVDECFSLSITHMAAYGPSGGLLLDGLLRFQQHMTVLLHLICNRRVREEPFQGLLQGQSRQRLACVTAA